MMVQRGKQSVNPSALYAVQEFMPIKPYSCPKTYHEDGVSQVEICYVTLTMGEDTILECRDVGPGVHSLHSSLNL